MYRPPNGVPEPVRIRLLGGFSLSVGSRTIEASAWRLRKAANLIKLLALSSGHRMHREQVMEVLWPDLSPRAASNNLRHVLHVARRVFDPDPSAGSRYLSLQDDQLVLCPGGQLLVDVEAFEETAAAARRSKDPLAYRTAIELYSGELLPEDRYEEWAERRREELRQLYLALLIELADLYNERGEHGSAVEALQKAVAEEPILEEAHRGLMRLYVLSFRPEQALAQYERLRELLSERLGREPAPATRRLHDEIAAGRITSIVPAGPPPEELPDADKHNLPAPRTSFVGREREIVEVKRLLAMTRLLTLTGAGGSGKTRFALEVAGDLVGVYPDGVWLVELAPVSEGTLVPQVVANALRVRELPGRAVTDTLVGALRTKQMLLLLDNCEHLVDSVARLVDNLLPSCPRLSILATSREPLGVEGEVVWRVSSLSVPHTDRLPTAAELTRYEAVRLFLDRVRLKLPAFKLTPENARAVARVCRGLEGIPLAIELVTARVGTLSVEQISGRLQDTLGLLSAGRRTSVPRQRTLRGTLDWSYGLLGESERVLFRRLSAFAGGWTLEAAEAVGTNGGVEKRDVLNLLSALVDKSLVLAEDGPMRYRMLEPVRQYVRELLEESGEAEAVRRRHAAYFLALAEEAEPELKGAAQEEWLERLEAKHDNFRAALSWAMGHSEAELGLRLSAALGEFWYMRGHLNEGRRWLEAALAKGDAPSVPRVKALVQVGWMLWEQGDFERSIALSEEGLALAREEGDKAGTARLLINLGAAVLLQGEPERAAAFFKESLPLLRKVEDRRDLTRSLLGLGLVALIRQDYGRAQALEEEGLALSRGSGDIYNSALLLSHLGLVALLQEQYDRAEALCKESLGLSRRLRMGHLITVSLNVLAASAASRGHPLRSARLWASAEALREEMGTPLSTPELHYYSPRIAAARAQIEHAAWEAASHGGRAMSVEEAIEYALSDEEVVPPMAAVPDQPSASTQAALTHREEEVASLVARGLTNRHIATELSISEHTVANHVAKILRKLGLDSRSQLTAWVVEQQTSP
jgi:predicted ATPase/DNA-binding SARP family transcriptional activator/DNA-binding CsgD family transcriptional regulator